MKKTLFIILGMLLSTQLGYSQETAKVYFMRTTGFQGSAQGFTAFIDGELTCKLNNKRYSVHEIAPGTHLFSVQFAGKKSKEKAAKEQITISVEAGKTYYIQMLFQTGILVNNLYCQEVTENSANTILPNLQEDTKCL
ncbi:DUF2846 domain-containing protein [Cellulophaga baltica]|uniref:DUF2846 domain-containing protein n=1 Tax=Cellulophaga baltica TaxID=76594 RepID=UPI0015F3E4C5|nr:DUF2846 domain-containing protein [Cellulophaga baltica]MBA6313426.1 DUF2846 domain-containing protein [Cellulophaga baltica]